MVAGGTESLSSMPVTMKSIPASARDYQQWMSPSHPETPDAPAFDMAITVGENTAREAGRDAARTPTSGRTTRTSARPASVANGWFDDEVVPVALPGGGIVHALTSTRGADTTLEKLASLPVLHPELDGATVTAGNAAGLNDAAAAVVVTSDEYAAGQRADAARPHRVVGVDRHRARAHRSGARRSRSRRRSTRAGMKIGDVDLFEINEAFCSMAVASSRQLGLDHDIVNVNGSGCGLGHPIAATGARMLVDDAARAAPARRSRRLRVDVRGRRHGLGPHRGAALAVSSPSCLDGNMPGRGIFERMPVTFEVLAEPNRRRILDHLLSGEAAVGDLVERLALAQPAVSKHLRVLKDAGLVDVRQDAQRRLYRLRPQPLAEIDQWLAPYRQLWSERLDALGAHLDQMPAETPTTRGDAP